MKRLGLIFAAVLLCLVAAAGCSSGGDGDGENSTNEGSSQQSASSNRAVTVQVAVNSQLKKPFDELIAAYEAEQSDVGIVASYGGTQASKKQVVDDKADIIIEKPDGLTDLQNNGRLSGQSMAFGSNPIQIVVPPGNPGNIDTLQAFGASTSTGMCKEEVQCGSQARASLQLAGVNANPSFTGTGDEVLDRVRAGELQAGLLLRTQGATLRPNPEWDVVAVPDEFQQPELFNIAAVKPGPAVDAFILWLQESPAANQILVKWGWR